MPLRIIPGFPEIAPHDRHYFKPIGLLVGRAAFHLRHITAPNDSPPNTFLFTGIPRLHVAILSSLACSARFITGK